MVAHRALLVGLILVPHLQRSVLAVLLGESCFTDKSADPGLVVQHHKPFHCLKIGLFAAFGGGIISSLLLQDPVRAPIALFSSNYLGLVWTTCWWLMNYCPSDLVAHVHGFLPVTSATKVLIHLGMS